MTAGERFKNWIESLSATWGDRLSGWMMSWASKGIIKSLESMEPGAIESYTASLTKLRDDPLTPPELKIFIDKALVPGNPISVVGGMLMMIVQAIGVVLGGSEPLSNLIKYSQEMALKTARLDPISAINAWRRDPERYNNVWQDLKEQGWDDSRIEALKFITQFLPSPRDLVDWQAKEVFEPAMIEKYGLDDEFGELDLSLFAKAGVTPEQALNFWRAHWEHASWNQVVEMVRRGQMTEQDVWDWFRLVEIPPFWRQKLINISWEVPTRVDVRRFWDMRTINEARLREIYTAQGYHGKDLEDYVLWTKIYVDFPDLMTRYQNGWLTLDDVRTRLTNLGMSAERAEELIQTKVKAIASTRMAKQKDLTMSQIVKGVKKDVITRQEGASLLEGMGYDPYEAAFILAIEIPEDEVVTAVEVRELTKSDVLNGLKAGIISEDDAMARLIGLRYTPGDADFILSIYRATAHPPAEESQRQASKADIVKAVKMGLITPEAAYLMLIDIGFSPEASEFILMVQAETSPFSPMNYSEFKALTDQWRQATGIGGPTMPDDIKKAAAEVVRLTTERDIIQRSIAEEKRKFVGQDVLPAEATAHLTQLQASLRQVEGELTRVKSEYDSLIAEWKHTI